MRQWAQKIDNGNLLGLTSSYETSDGTHHDMADVWFLANRVGAIAGASVARAADHLSVDQAIAALNITAVPSLAEPLPLHALAGSGVPVGALPIGSAPFGAMATALQVPEPMMVNTTVPQALRICTVG